MSVNVNINNPFCSIVKQHVDRIGNCLCAIAKFTHCQKLYNPNNYTNLVELSSEHVDFVFFELYNSLFETNKNLSKHFTECNHYNVNLEEQIYDSIIEVLPKDEIVSEQILDKLKIHFDQFTQKLLCQIQVSRISNQDNSAMPIEIESISTQETIDAIQALVNSSQISVQIKAFKNEYDNEVLHTLMYVTMMLAQLCSNSNLNSMNLSNAITMFHIDFLIELLVFEIKSSSDAVSDENFDQMNKIHAGLIERKILEEDNSKYFTRLYHANALKLARFFNAIRKHLPNLSRDKFLNSVRNILDEQNGTYSVNDNDTSYVDHAIEGLYEKYIDNDEFIDSVCDKNSFKKVSAAVPLEFSKYNLKFDQECVLMRFLNLFYFVRFNKDIFESKLHLLKNRLI